MKVKDIPIKSKYVRKIFGMSDLLRRAKNVERASWIDLPKGPGIYVVYWDLDKPPTFVASTGYAVCAVATNPEVLRHKWDRIQAYRATDIVYFGKGDDLKERVKLLVRFGVGKANNHHGGEWMWQVQEIDSAKLLVQSCPLGKQIAFENWLLEQFRNIHGDWPLANRNGPKGEMRWKP